MRPYMTGHNEAPTPGGSIDNRNAGGSNIQMMYDANSPSIAIGEEGPGGRVLFIPKTGANFSDFQNEYGNLLGQIPTTDTDLYDILPTTASPMHPNHSGAKQGCHELWERLINKNPDQLLSEVGWPVAAPFIEDFDVNNGFGSSYSGNYDANGNNV